LGSIHFYVALQKGVEIAVRRDVLIIKDPEVAKLFADETRRKILYALRHHDLATADLARGIGKSYSSIIHHLNLLREAGLVEETRVEKRGNLLQTYYRSTAKRFIISYSLSEALNEDGDTLTWQEDLLQNTMEALEAFGIDVPEGERDRALDLTRAFFLRDQKAFEETIEQQLKPASSGRWGHHRVVRLLTRIKLSEDPEYVRVVRDLRRLLKSSAESEGRGDH